MLKYVGLIYFIHIGKTTNMVQLLRSYNSGHPYSPKKPPYIRSYAFFAHILYFNCNSHLVYYAIQIFKEIGD